jgi:ABC-type branched-subunit amino acid transport system ATPase component
LRQLRCEGLTCRFGGVCALDGVALTFDPGEITAIVGPNGAGKSTLINVLSGYVRPDRGQWYWGATELTKLPPFKIARAGVTRTFQQVRVANQVTVLDNLLLAFRGQKGERLSNAILGIGIREQEKQNHERARELLELVGLEQQALLPAEVLSFGQQKLVSIACCLAMDPDVIMLDEPVSGVDYTLRSRILALLAQLRDRGKLTIFVEHDITAVREVANRAVVMNAGKVLCQGQPGDILRSPEVVEAFLG